MPQPLVELVPTHDVLVHHPSLVFQAKDAHRSIALNSGDAEVGCRSMANELRMAGQPSPYKPVLTAAGIAIRTDFSRLNFCALGNRRKPDS